MLRNLFFALIVLSQNPLIAQDLESKGGTFDWMAYVDTYYSWDSNEPLDNQKQYVTQAARHNEFNINLAAFKVSYNSDNLRSNLTLQSGTYPITNYAEPSPLGQIINEANVGINIFGDTWIDMGIMGGHFGYESAFTLNNELYTQALSTEYTPYYQTGIQLSAPLMPGVNFRAVIVNGWQNIFETNDAKSGGIALDYQLNDQLFFGYGNYFGNEGNDVTGKKYRFHNNLVASYSGQNFSSTLTLDLTSQELLTSSKKSTVLFITWINKFVLTEKLSIGARYEYVADPDQILLSTIAPGFQTNIISASLNYYATPNAAVKLEVKQHYGEESIWTEGENDVSNNNFVINAGFALRINKDSF